MSGGKDGGAAFPVSYGPDGTPGYGEGMSLRDYFAGQALAGMHLAIGRDLRGHADVVAESAYAYADAMLRAREATS